MCSTKGMNGKKERGNSICSNQWAVEIGVISYGHTHRFSEEKPPLALVPLDLFCCYLMRPSRANTVPWDNSHAQILTGLSAVQDLQLRSHLTYPPHLWRGKLPKLIQAGLFNRKAVRRNECYRCLVMFRVLQDVLAGCSCSLNKMRESHKHWQSSVLLLSQSWASKQLWVCQLFSQISMPLRSRFSTSL